MLDHLIIFQKLYDLILFLHPIINKFPQKQRFVLGQQIQNGCIDVLKYIIEANNEIQKLPALKKVSIELDKLRVLFRLSKDLHFISIKQYETTSDRMNEIGRLLQGWIKKFS